MRNKKCFFLLLMNAILSIYGHIEIPEYLQECYTNDVLQVTQLPLNLKIIINIIQKAEKYASTSMNMRLMATSLLHRFKFDGIGHHTEMPEIEGVINFSGNQPQRIKHRIVEELIPGNSEIFPSAALTLMERCTLHWAISNTIMWHHYSKNESQFCSPGPIEKITSRTTFRDSQICIKEGGVILTPYGTLALGSVIAAIAASLQSEKVSIQLLLSSSDINFQESDMATNKLQWKQSFTDLSIKIDNLWMATLAGELAEVTVYQGPIYNNEISFDATGFWNNTMRPSVYYITRKKGNFDMTRAEIIGGIDGLIISKYIHDWLNKMQSIRLSQILSMYYSEKGVSFNKNIRACERGKTYMHVISKSILEDQTYAASKLLAARNSVPFITNEALKKMVNNSVKSFMHFTDYHLFTEMPCKEEELFARVEVLLTFDGSWSREYTANFLAVLIEDLEVSMFGSKLGIMHATNGNWLIEVTNSLSSIHDIINQFDKITWPSYFNYTHILENALHYLNNKWTQNRKDYIIGNHGQAIVILAPNEEISANEKNTAITVLKQIKEKHPEVHILYYVTEYNAHFFKPFLLTDEDYIIRSANIDDITKYLLKVPATLRPQECRKFNLNSKEQFEDYVNPSQTLTYRLHPKWRQNTNTFILTVHGVAYGSMKVCSWYQWTKNGIKEGMYCITLSGSDEIYLKDYSKCSRNQPCPDMYYRVQNVTSLQRCTEMDCGRPDKLKFIIRAENIHCSNGNYIIVTLDCLLLYLTTCVLINVVK